MDLSGSGDSVAVVDVECHRCPVRPNDVLAEARNTRILAAEDML
jgi:Ni,Fe-hydrogenase III small subunit